MGGSTGVNCEYLPDGFLDVFRSAAVEIAFPKLKAHFCTIGNVVRVGTRLATGAAGLNTEDDIRIFDLHLGEVYLFSHLEETNLPTIYLRYAGFGGHHRLFDS